MKLGLKQLRKIIIQEIYSNKNGMGEKVGNVSHEDIIPIGETDLYDVYFVASKPGALRIRQDRQGAPDSWNWENKNWIDEKRVYYAVSEVETEYKELILYVNKKGYVTAEHVPFSRSVSSKKVDEIDHGLKPLVVGDYYDNDRYEFINDKNDNFNKYK